MCPSLGRALEIATSPTNRSRARNACGYSILTEHSGVELGEYGADLLNVIRDKWYSMIPKSTDPADPPRTAVVDFVLKKHGALGKMRIEESSGDKTLDSAAWDAIQTAVPFPLPPPNFPSKSLKLRFYFEYSREPVSIVHFAQKVPGVCTESGVLCSPLTLSTNRILSIPTKLARRSARGWLPSDWL
jgi:TonB family protein